MWKKRISWLLITMLTLSMLVFAAGCGDTETVKPEQTPPTQENTAPEIDEAAIAFDLAKDYFTYLPDGVMLKVDDVKDQLANFYIIDVRSADAYAQGHIEGAVNIGFKELGNKMDTFPKDKPLLMVCYSGQNANQATGVLRVAGFDAHALIGGMNGGWLKAELPTVQ